MAKRKREEEEGPRKRTCDNTRRPPPLEESMMKQLHAVCSSCQPQKLEGYTWPSLQKQGEIAAEPGYIAALVALFEHMRSDAAKEHSILFRTVNSTEERRGSFVADGTFGNVYDPDNTGEHVIKWLKTDGIGAFVLWRAVKEIYCLWQLSSQGHHIAPLEAVILAADEGATVPVVKGLMLGHRGQALGEFLKARKVLNGSQVLSIVRDLAEMLEDAHARGIAHMDLFTDNVCIRAEKGGKVSASLIDFGSARVFGGAAEHVQALAPPNLPPNPGPRLVYTGPAGHERHRPPELFFADEQSEDVVAADPTKIDVFGFSILAWEILTREAPFSGQIGHRERFVQMQCGRRPDLKKLLRAPMWCQLLERCWVTNPKVRLSFAATTRYIRLNEKALKAEADAVASRGFGRKKKSTRARLSP